MTKKIFQKFHGFSSVELVIMVGFGALAAAALIYLGTTPQQMASTSQPQDVNVNIKVDSQVAKTTETRTPTASASQTTGDYCNAGVNSLFGFDLHGENIQCGNETVCVTKSQINDYIASQNSVLNQYGIPPLPNPTAANLWNQPLLMLMYAYTQYLPYPAPFFNVKNFIKVYGAQFAFTHYGPDIPETLALMPKPSDLVFADEPEFAALNNKTHRFEFLVPKSYTTDPDTSIKMRGWYIDGSGMSGKDPVIIMTPGISQAIGDNYNALLRKSAAYYVSQGFDVILYDKRNHGYSEGPAATWGEDIFRMLDQLETGVEAMGPNDTEPSLNTSLLGSGYTAKSKPVVLWGLSMGAMQMTNAMAMNYGNEPIDPRYDANGNFDSQASAAVSASRSGYNFRGVVEDSGWAGSLKYQVSPVLLWLHGAALTEPEFHTQMAINGYVQDSMDKWPGYMAVKPTQDYGTPDGPVDIYNNKLKGFKRIVMVEGKHGVPFYDPEKNSYIVGEVAKFAKQVVLNDATFDNYGQTTIQKEACKAIVIGDSGRLEASDLTLQGQLDLIMGGYVSQ